MATQSKKKLIVHEIESWFSENARAFPWRTDDFPWGRLVSEFMSQQTQIDRVALKWPLILERFPTPKSLAQSNEQNILSLWQGLGYYRRAKFLKKTAEIITEDFAGEVPSDVNDLLKLSGVGKYTAGAISSIAFDKREAIVDANVHRVLCRLWNHAGEWAPSSWTWGKAEQLVSVCSSPKVFNEGLMEFGATVCSKSPKCETCPLQGQCDAFTKSTQSKLPTVKKKTKKKKVFHYAVVLEHQGEFAFEQRGDTGLWSGMWQVPTVDSDVELDVNEISKQLNVRGKLKMLGSFEHMLSHRAISFTVFSCKVGKDSRFNWFSAEALEELPLATAQRKVLAVHCAA